MGQEGEKTYFDLDRESDALGAYLRQHGVLPNDRVGIFMETRPDYVTSSIGALKASQNIYLRYKVDINRSLLLGLGILVAADISETLAFELSFRRVGVLAVLIIIRTFLSWVLLLEVEGRWPWQPVVNDRSANGAP